MIMVDPIRGGAVAGDGVELHGGGGVCGGGQENHHIGTDVCLWNVTHVKP